jgi:dTDP-glucose 4,6-dehydratase
VYGRQPLDLSHLPETWEGAPQISDSNSAYHEGKRVAELMGNIAATKQGLQFVTARLFAFIAPFLPLGTHFAAGNFIRDAATSNQIEIQSGGGSVRSYLYATDLCSSLWALLARGVSMRAYNVGSEQDVTIKDLALEIASCTNRNAEVVIHGVDDTENVNRYVPSVDRAFKELNVSQTVSLSQSILRTSNWLTETRRNN